MGSDLVCEKLAELTMNDALKVSIEIEAWLKGRRAAGAEINPILQDLAEAIRPLTEMSLVREDATAQNLLRRIALAENMEGVADGIDLLAARVRNLLEKRESPAAERRKSCPRTLLRL